MSSDHLRKRGYRADRVRRFVAEALEYTLLPALNDPLFTNVHVLSVETTNNLACVRVVLAGSSTGPGRDSQAVEEALKRAEPLLRSELAAMLRIKRMPLLRLSYIEFATHSGEESGERGGACE